MIIVPCYFLVNVRVLREVSLHLRQRLRIWNHEKFRLIHKRVNKANQQLDDIQRDLDFHGASEARLQAKAGTQKAYLKALKDEESFWRDKARISWLTNGDHNTSLFHKVARHWAIQG